MSGQADAVPGFRYRFIRATRGYAGRAMDTFTVSGLGVWQGTPRRNSRTILTRCHATSRRAGRALVVLAGFRLKASLHNSRKANHGIGLHDADSDQVPFRFTLWSASRSSMLAKGRESNIQISSGLEALMTQLLQWLAEMMIKATMANIGNTVEGWLSGFAGLPPRQRSVARRISWLFSKCFELIFPEKVPTFRTILPSSLVLLIKMEVADAVAFMVELTTIATAKGDKRRVAANPLLTAAGFHQWCTVVTAKTTDLSGNWFRFQPIVSHSYLG